MWGRSSGFGVAFRCVGRFWRGPGCGEVRAVSGWTSGALEGFGNVAVGVAEGDGAAMGAAGGVFGLGEGVDEPCDLLLIEGLIDLDGGVAGDAGGDAAAASVGVFGLLAAIGGGEELFEHDLEFPALEAYGCGFDGEGAWSEGFGFEAVAVELVGDLGEGDHLGGEQVDEERHEEALALDLLGVALAHDFFEEDALVGDVLVDDPESFFVDG